MLLVVLGLLLLAAPASAAGELPFALEPWDNAARAAMPPWLRAWLGFLALSFVASLAFVRAHVAARWALGGFIASHALVAIIDLGGLAFVRRGLVSLLHIACWSPAVPFLLRDAKRADAASHYRLWCRVLLGVIAVAFVFDLRDAASYLYHVLAGHPGLGE